MRNPIQFIRFFILNIFIVILLALGLIQKTVAADNTNIISSLPTLYSSNNLITAPSFPQNTQNNQSSNNPSALVQNLGLDHWDVGPFSFSGKYDSLLGMIFDTQYAQKINPNWAVGLIGEYGPNQYRFNGTLGTQLSQNTQLKVSGEYLSQVLPFNFDSGNINQRVGQSAYGLDVRQNLHNPLFQDLETGAYWAKAPSISLANRIFTQNDFLYTNQRNLAGAISQGLNVGTDLTLSPLTLLKAKILYDSVNYHTQLTSNTTENNAAFGSALELDQIINGQMKFSMSAEKRAIYDTYNSELDWHPSFAQPLNTEFALVAQHLTSNNQTPSSNTIGLKVSLADDTPKSSNYTLARSADLSDLLPWVKDPAVYMQRVLVVSEQRTTLNAPTINAIVPDSGPFVGGNIIYIYGTNFLPGISITFGGIAGTVTVLSPTQLMVVVPAISPLLVPQKTSSPITTQNVEVVITNPDGQHIIFTPGYTYTTANAPTLTNVSPASGVPSGGTSVTLTGTKLTGTTVVTFGSTAATNIHVVNDSTVTADTPAHVAGAVNVKVTTPQGNTTLTNGFTYLVNAPTVSSVSPTSGPASGGTSVTITGTHFTDTTAVHFGNTDAVSFIVNSDSSITAISPADSAGTVNITVTTPTGTSSTSSADEYTYVSPPTVTSVSPSSGYTVGGTSVTITGTHFTDATAVHFGATTASSFTVDSDTTITAISPADNAGTVDVTVTTSAGTSSTSSADEFTYTNPPHIIFVTNSTYSGSLGGLSGANSSCNSDSAKPSSGFAANYTYKALLNGNNATTLGVTYYRPDGTTLIATATGGNLVGTSSLNNAISASATTVWTGGNGSATCSSWVSTSSTGSIGASNSSTSTYWSATTSSCALPRHLYCVSQ